jgi:putative addiction module antidote
MTAIKLTKIGNSTGAIFPKEVLANLKAEAGDVIYLTQLPGGGYRISPYSDTLDGQMEAARKVMKDWRNALRELAK